MSTATRVTELVPTEEPLYSYIESTSDYSHISVRTNNPEIDTAKLKVIPESGLRTALNEAYGMFESIEVSKTNTELECAIDNNKTTMECDGPVTVRNEAYGRLTEDSVTGDDYYVNEGMGGINKVTMKTNEAYGTTKQPQMAKLTYDYIVNPSAVSHDPPTTLNLAYGDVTKDSVIATDANKSSGTAEVEMTRNEAYVGVRQTSSDNDPPQRMRHTVQSLHEDELETYYYLNLILISKQTLYHVYTSILYTYNLPVAIFTIDIK